MPLIIVVKTFYDSTKEESYRFQKINVILSKKATHNFQKANFILSKKAFYTFQKEYFILVKKAFYSYKEQSYRFQAQFDNCNSCISGNFNNNAMRT